jgi:hypothetical protein
MRVHGIICTYLGDGELDLGKTARWLQYFTDSIFFYDANGTDNRRYAVDYAKSWPPCQFAYHPSSAAKFQAKPEVMRQMAFQAADAAWSYDANDWVIYVDGTEGISTDVPHDALELLPGSDRFRYLYDEAQAATQPYIGLAFRAFVSQGTVVERTYDIDPTLGDVPYNKATWWSNDPHYLDLTNVVSSRYLLRMARVSALRTAPVSAFQAMDTYNMQGPGFVAGQHAGIISYAYARFSEVDYDRPDLWVEANDQGFATRLFMQQVPGRNIPQLPSVYTTPDPVGYPITVPPGPARISVFDDQANVFNFGFTGHVTQESGNETYAWNFGDTTTGAGQQVSHVFPGSGPYPVVLTVTDPDVTGTRRAQVTIAPSTLDPITPQDPPPPGTPPNRMLSAPYCYYINQVRGQYLMVFTALWRKNPRDGAWWDPYVIGPVPLSPTTGQPDVGLDTSGEPYDPAQWTNQQPQGRVVVTRPDEAGAGV